MPLDFVIENGKVITESSQYQADVGVRDGKIAAIGSDLSEISTECYDASGCYVAPGFIDGHVHMGLPVAGTRSSDDFFTGGRAAAYGGITSIIDFTTPGPGQTITGAIRSRQEYAADCPIDYSLHATLYGFDGVDPGDVESAIDLGVTTFKFFTTYSESDRYTGDGELLDALVRIPALGGKLMVHCENDEIIKRKRKKFQQRGKKAITNHPKTRPAYSESSAVNDVIELTEIADGDVHLAHISSKRSLTDIAKGVAEGVNMTAETCPQYLLLTEECYQEEDGYLYSATPPLRTVEDNQALWTAIQNGLINSVATDHCPFKNEQKDPYRDDFLNIPQGLPGVETLVSLLYTEGVEQGRISLTRFVQLLSTNPARIFGLYPEKGSLQVGTDADIAVIDPEVEKTLTPDSLHMNTDFNPYRSYVTAGWPRFVFLRGRLILEEDNFHGDEGPGKFIRRSSFD